MFFNEGLSCPVCGKPFAATDDIVACPLCGAPHHRACWEESGHCHFESDHGTDRQWSREAAVAKAAPAPAPSAPVDGAAHPCPRCGAQNPEYAEFCCRCGNELHPSDWQTGTAVPPPIAPPTSGQYSEYSPFQMPVGDPYGGVPKEEDIGGVSAEDLALTVRANTPYYLPHFRRIAHGSRISWNWCAFLVPSYWLLYRKNYLTGLMMLLFTVTRNLLTDYVTYLYVAPIQLANPSAGWADIAQQLLQNTGFQLASYMMVLLLVADILLRIILGMMGNALYLRTCTSRIQKAHAGYPEGYKAQLSAIGGVSLTLVIVAIMASQFFSLLMSYFWV